MIVFWFLAPIMVLAALGILFVRKAVHAALLLAVVMIGLAFLYAIQDSPFLFAVQIIVYTGAILMLFLFVVMVVGVEASDSVVETIRGQRLFAFLAGIAMVVLLLTAAGQLTIKVIGLQQYQAEGGMAELAQAMFSPYVFAFEATSALLITAAVGAMILAHRERLTPKIGQRAMALQRMQDYADSGKHPGPLAAPGVFARHNAVDTPGLLPDGTPARESISRVLAARGSIKQAPDDVEEIEQEILLPSDEREDDL